MKSAMTRNSGPVSTASFIVFIYYGLHTFVQIVKLLETFTTDNSIGLLQKLNGTFCIVCTASAQQTLPIIANTVARAVGYCTQYHDSKVERKVFFHGCNHWMKRIEVHWIVSGCCYASFILTKHDHCAFCGCYTSDFLLNFISSITNINSQLLLQYVCQFHLSGS